MKRTATLSIAALAVALILGAFAWTPAAEAWEPICFNCSWNPWAGYECIDTPGGGMSICYREASMHCILAGTPCNGLTSIER